MDTKSAAEARRARILAGGKDRIRLAKGEAPDSTDGEATNNDNSNPPSEEKAPRRSSIAKRKEARARKEAAAKAAASGTIPEENTSGSSSSSSSSSGNSNSENNQIIKESTIVRDYIKEIEEEVKENTAKNDANVMRKQEDEIRKRDVASKLLNEDPIDMYRRKVTSRPRLLGPAIRTVAMAVIAVWSPYSSVILALLGIHIVSTIVSNFVKSKGVASENKGTWISFAMWILNNGIVKVLFDYIFEFLSEISLYILIRYLTTHLRMNSDMSDSSKYGSGKNDMHMEDAGINNIDIDAIDDIELKFKLQNAMDNAEEL